MRRRQLTLFVLCLLVPMLLLGWPVPTVASVNGWVQRGLAMEEGFGAFVITWAGLFTAYTVAVYLSIEGTCTMYRRVGEAAHSVRHLLG